MPHALSVDIIYRVLCCLVDITVLFLNPIIISVIYKDRQLRRQPSTIYIANLALVDMCLAGVNFANLLFHYLEIMKLFSPCMVVHGYFPMSLQSASLLFMFTNSVDRFVFITMSLKYHAIMNSKIAKYVAIIIWVYSIFYPLFPYVIFGHAWDFDNCYELLKSELYKYGHMPVLIIFVVTIILTVIMFVSVFRVVHKSRRLRQLPHGSSSVASQLSATLYSHSPTSIPSLPVIPELIPYEHDDSEFSSQTCETNASSIASDSRERFESDDSERHSLADPHDLATTSKSWSEEDYVGPEPRQKLQFTLNEWNSDELTESEDFTSPTLPDLLYSLSVDYQDGSRQRQLAAARRASWLIDALPMLRLREQAASSYENLPDSSDDISIPGSAISDENITRKYLRALESLLKPTRRASLGLLPRQAAGRKTSFEDSNNSEPAENDIPEQTFNCDASAFDETNTSDRLTESTDSLVPQIKQESVKIQQPLIIDGRRISPAPKRRSPLRSVSTITTTSSGSVPFGSPVYSGRDLRTLKILFLMFCVYIILWMPSFTMSALKYFHVDVSMDFFLIGYTFAVSNSVFNFFVYPMRIPKLRVSFKQLFKEAVKDFSQTLRTRLSKKRNK